MASVWVRKSTWAVLAAALFGAGAAVIRLTAPAAAQAETVLANPPEYDVVSRAPDSELEISPTLASQRDGTLAVAWVSQSGGRDELCGPRGCGASGQYVGVRVSAPSAGKLGPLVRFRAAPGARVADPTLVPLGAGQDFLLVWREARGGAPGNVYTARVARGSASGPTLVASHAVAARAATTPGGLVLVAVAFEEGAVKGLALATSPDGKTFTRHVVSSSEHLPALPAVCGDNHLALVTGLDETRGLVAYAVPLAPDGPVAEARVSSFGEHVARDTPSCFVSGEEAYVVYGLTEQKPSDLEAAIVTSLAVVRSHDGGRDFVTRATHRTPSRLLHPAVLHRNGSFTVLAVMGSGRGDSHASASVLALAADGRSQLGLTRTAVAPIKMTLAPDGAGYMGDSLGLTAVGNVVWTAVTDNGSGESHVALVRVL